MRLVRLIGQGTEQVKTGQVNLDHLGEHFSWALLWTPLWDGLWGGIASSWGSVKPTERVQHDMVCLRDSIAISRYMGPLRPKFWSFSQNILLSRGCPHCNSGICC